MAEKIKVLFLAANPANTKSRIRLDEEAREIREIIWNGPARDLIEFIPKFALRPSDLQKALLTHQPHIIHFSGHGDKEQGIILEDRQGHMKAVSKQALGDLFKILKDNIRVVVLNACHSNLQIEAVTEVIDFTITMKGTIGDDAAVTFAPHFYQAIAHGRSVKEAFELARNELDLEGIPESDTPSLLEREGMQASKAYLIGAQS
jgi:CHAT domain-containing protein